MVKQDYFAKLFILNYTALLIRPIDRLLQKQPKVKHTHKVNFNEALACMKYAVVDLFLFQKIPETLQKLFKAFYTFTEPIRKNRKFKRHKLPPKKNIIELTALFELKLMTLVLHLYFIRINK